MIATRPATTPEAAPRGGVAVADPLDEQPAEDRGARWRPGVDPGDRGGLARWRPSAEPALKPNQPNHSRPAPSITSGRLCGRIGSRFEADPLAEHQRQRQARGTGVDVDRRTAGEVDAPQLVGDPAAASWPCVPSKANTQCATGK